MKKQSLQEKIIYAERSYAIYHLYNKKIRALYYKIKLKHYEKQLEKFLTH